jgi:hypothetical protein
MEMIIGILLFIIWLAPVIQLGRVIEKNGNWDLYDD